MAGMMVTSLLSQQVQMKGLQQRITELENCLETARDGLVWYGEECPHLRDGADDEMLTEIARLIGPRV